MAFLRGSAFEGVQHGIPDTGRHNLPTEASLQQQTQCWSRGSQT